MTGPHRIQRTVSPGDSSVVAERELADAPRIDGVLARAVAAQRDWRRTGLDGRIAVVEQLDAQVQRAHRERQVAAVARLQQQRVAGETTFELDTGGESYRYYLLWIVDLVGRATVNEVRAAD